MILIKNIKVSDQNLYSICSCNEDCFFVSYYNNIMLINSANQKKIKFNAKHISSIIAIKKFIIKHAEYLLSQSISDYNIILWRITKNNK